MKKILSIFVIQSLFTTQIFSQASGMGGAGSSSSGAASAAAGALGTASGTSGVPASSIPGTGSSSGGVPAAIPSGGIPTGGIPTGGVMPDYSGSIGDLADSTNNAATSIGTVGDGLNRVGAGVADFKDMVDGWNVGAHASDANDSFSVLADGVSTGVDGFIADLDETTDSLTKSVDQLSGSASNLMDQVASITPGKIFGASAAGAAGVAVGAVAGSTITGWILNGAAKAAQGMYKAFHELITHKKRDDALLERMSSLKNYYNEQKRGEQTLEELMGPTGMFSNFESMLNVFEKKSKLNGQSIAEGTRHEIALEYELLKKDLKRAEKRIENKEDTYITKQDELEVLAKSYYDDLENFEDEVEFARKLCKNVENGDYKNLLPAGLWDLLGSIDQIDQQSDRRSEDLVDAQEKLEKFDNLKTFFLDGGGVNTCKSMQGSINALLKTEGITKNGDVLNFIDGGPGVEIGDEGAFTMQDMRTKILNAKKPFFKNLKDKMKESKRDARRANNGQYNGTNKSSREVMRLAKRHIDVTIKPEAKSKMWDCIDDFLEDNVYNQIQPDGTSYDVHEVEQVKKVLFYADGSDGFINVLPRVEVSEEEERILVENVTEGYQDEVPKGSSVFKQIRPTYCLDRVTGEHPELTQLYHIQLKAEGRLADIEEDRQDRVRRRDSDLGKKITTDFNAEIDMAYYYHKWFEQIEEDSQLENILARQSKFKEWSSRIDNVCNRYVKHLKKLPNGSESI